MAAALSLGLLLAGCGGREAPVASDAWVRLAAVPGRPAAGYFTLHGGAKPVTLAALEVAGVPRVELHESRMTGSGMMAMDAVASVPVPAGGTVKFARRLSRDAVRRAGGREAGRDADDDVPVPGRERGGGTGEGGRRGRGGAGMISSRAEEGR
ncbi:copper chaperone PCu(A)C [Sphingomonas sp. MMS24-JH45]